MTDHSYWYAARAAGLSAYLLLAFSVIWGLAISTKLMGRTGKGAIYEAHRITSISVLGLTLLHVLSLLGDTYVKWDLKKLFLPFTSEYRPTAVAAGVIVLYLVAIVTASFYVRKQIGQKTWRRLHYVSFLTLGAAVFHGVAAGTDTGEPWARALYLGPALVVLFLVNLRLLGGASAPRDRSIAPDGGTAPRGRELAGAHVQISQADTEP